ncbi:hypothetical protein [Ruegeria jejuensis]|uniref:hypothetical protein n=1 Tax=Ruegeria jejuensis TaxID=3233338 RepID=UPI00355BBFEB
MFEALLTTTTSEGLQPLGTAAQRSYELVTGALRQRLGADYANLLAEPVSTPHGDRIDWHAPMAGRPMRLSDLAPEEQDVLKARLGEMISAILAEAETLDAGPGSDDHRLGEALRNAVEIPSEDMIHVVRSADGDHPVLVHWAWVSGERMAVRGVLTKMVPRAQPLSAVQSGPVASVWTSPVWWWLILLGWLLLAALLGLILYLMIHPCGLSPFGPDHCHEDTAELSAAYSEYQVLNDRVARLQHEIALTDRACKPVVPIAPAEAAPAEPLAPQPEKEGGLLPDLIQKIKRLAGLEDASYTVPEAPN